jgi:hypothetical protein
VPHDERPARERRRPASQPSLPLRLRSSEK